MKRSWSAAALEAARHPSDRVPPVRAAAWKRGWRTWLALNVTELTWTALLIGLVLFVSLFTPS